MRMGHLADIGAYGEDAPSNIPRITVTPRDPAEGRDVFRLFGKLPAWDPDKPPPEWRASPPQRSWYDYATMPARAIVNMFSTPEQPFGTLDLGPQVTEAGAYGQRANVAATEEKAHQTARAMTLPVRNPFGPIAQAELRGDILTAGARRGRRPIYTPNEAPGSVVDPRTYGLGHNNPPPEFRLEPPPAAPVAAPVAAPTAQEAYSAWNKTLPRPQPSARSTEIPDIRNLPVDQAIEQARKQSHLIKAGDQSAGAYVGGPRDVQSKAALNKIRSDFDAFVAKDPQGGDWYDRYRGGLALSTGGDPVANEWQSKMHGQFSAGVDPGSELHFVLKENNAQIAGMPVKAARPAQHEALAAAIAARDPNLLQLGEKTGEYAAKVNPDQPGPAGATGVNDFRHARNFGYTEPSGEPQKGALGAAGHKFLDYETALAVDRANQANLGGRSDWTGEQLQAAPWVVQKAEDLMSRNPNLSYEDAMARAMRTITDYYPRHTYFATHEAQPGADVVGHMTGSVNAPQSVKDQFALDPRSNWATAPMGRDAIYSGLGIEGTGVKMRVLPSQRMQGLYVRPDGTTEMNIGQVARPLGTFNTGGKNEPFKSATPADRVIMDAGESLRGYLDAQNASAWHKLWFGGPTKESTSLFFPREGPASTQELLDLRAVAGKHGLGDVVDTGQGITATQFYQGPPAGGKAFESELRKGERGEFGRFGAPERARVDSGYIDYVDKWQKPGSGEATRAMLEHVNKTPELRAAFNNNTDIPKAALARFERDKEWGAKWGAPREDIQTARRIIGEGGAGWVDRLEAALKAGVILPATVAAIFAAAQGARSPGQDHGQL